MLASVTLVHLPRAEGAGREATPDYLLRSQPDAACMSTMEAIARCDAIPKGLLASGVMMPHPGWTVMSGAISYMTFQPSCCRALSIMEGDASIEAALLKPLRLMTALQVGNATASPRSDAC